MGIHTPSDIPPPPSDEASPSEESSPSEYRIPELRFRRLRDAMKNNFVVLSQNESAMSLSDGFDAAVYAADNGEPYAVPTDLQPSRQLAKSVRPVLNKAVKDGDLRRFSAPVFRLQSNDAANEASGPAYIFSPRTAPLGHLLPPGYFDGSALDRPASGYRWPLARSETPRVPSSQFEPFLVPTNIPNELWRSLATRLAEVHGGMGTIRETTFYTHSETARKTWHPSLVLTPEYVDPEPDYPDFMLAKAFRSRDREYLDGPLTATEWRNHPTLGLDVCPSLHLRLTSRLISLFLRDPRFDYRGYVRDDTFFAAEDEYRPLGYCEDENGDLMAVYCGIGCNAEALRLIHSTFERSYQAPSRPCGLAEMKAAFDARNTNICAGYVVF